ncbi:unnamed protein product [Ophioblennius macclurei]
MSRLIVKNLPNGMKEERFKSMFAAFGTVTDCTLKFTKDGKFRKFGFVGFKSEEDAARAQKHFNKSFVDTSRVAVEMCKAFGDPTKAKAWSKHSHSSGQEKPPATAAPEGKKKNQQKKESSSALKNLEDDQEFKEFLSVHQNRSQAPIWANDTVQDATRVDKKQTKTQSKKKQESDDYLNFDSEESEDGDEDEAEEEEEEEDDEDEATPKEALKSGLSDMDYLRSKVARTADIREENEEQDDDDDDNDDAMMLMMMMKMKKRTMVQCSTQTAPMRVVTEKTSPRPKHWFLQMIRSRTK